MKVLLIIPTSFYKSRYPAFLSSQDFPVGFAYLASSLKAAGHKVFGLNPNNDVNYTSAFEMISDRIAKAIRDIQPDIVGVGGLCIDFKFIKDAMSIIRKISPDTPIVCGGGIINNDTEYIFQILKPDFCIVGEGEEAFVNLVNCIGSGDHNYDSIDNLGFWRNGTPLFTQRSFNYVDINKLSFPDYEPFNIKDMIDNFSFSTRVLHRYPRENPRPMTIVTARNCPFQCTFCVHHRREAKYRARSLENIIEEIDYIYEKYEFNILVIMDELFAVNKKRLNDFCDQLGNMRSAKGWDFDWMFQTHASASLDRAALQKAKNVGCYYFSYGIESASPTVLKNMNKKTNPQQIKEAIEAASDVGIGFGGNFIFGDPAETPMTISETMKFIHSNCLDNHIYLGVIHPYPGSKIFEYCINKKIIKDKLRFYETIDEADYNMTALPDWLFRRWVELLYKHSEQFTWVKSANAIRFLKRSLDSDDIYLSRSGQKLIEVQAKCPHCGMESIYIEPITRNVADREKKIVAISDVTLLKRIKRAWFKVNKNNSSLLNLMAFVVFSFREINIILLRSLRKIPGKLITSATRRMKIFRIVESLDVNGIHSDISFITGCKHCHKRYRINIMPGAFPGPETEQ